MVLAVMPKHGESYRVADVLRRRSAPCLVVLDSAYRIVIAEPRLSEFLREAGVGTVEGDRLPPTLEHAVRSLTASGFNGHEPLANASAPVPGLIVRTSVLLGPAGACAAVSLEHLRSRDPLKAATERFRLSKREREVLALILRGLEAREIALHLHIAESTVGDYFKHLSAKIGAKNRAAMLARVFDWPE